MVIFFLDGLSCPQGWEQMSTSCYHVRESERSYDNAVTYCNSIGGSLVEVYSLDEMEYLAVLLDHNRAGSYYIGANCKIMVRILTMQMFVEKRESRLLKKIYGGIH